MFLFCLIFYFCHVLHVKFNAIQVTNWKRFGSVLTCDYLVPEFLSTIGYILICNIDGLVFSTFLVFENKLKN